MRKKLSQMCYPSKFLTWMFVQMIWVEEENFRMEPYIKERKNFSYSMYRSYVGMHIDLIAYVKISNPFAINLAIYLQYSSICKIIWNKSPTRIMNTQYTLLQWWSCTSIHQTVQFSLYFNGRSKGIRQASFSSAIPVTKWGKWVTVWPFPVLQIPNSNRSKDLQ